MRYNVRMPKKTNNPAPGPQGEAVKKVRLNQSLPEPLHYRLKVQAAREKKTIQELVSDLLEEGLRGRGAEFAAA